jgi:hypothetical protein
MKSRTLTILTVAMALQSGSLWAATFPGANNRDSLMSAESLGRLSIGVDYEAIKRDILVGPAGAQIEDLIEARAVDGYLGVDITDWLTPFVTLGASAVLDAGTDEYADYTFKWSAGLNFNIWHYDIVSPDFLAGRLSIETIAEYASYASDDVRFEGDNVEWSDTTVALPFCYELFEDLSPLADKSLRKSLNLYVGPAFSAVDGTFISGSNETKFQEDQQFGFMGGGDIFFAEKLSIGAHVRVFGEVSVTGALRFHF